MEGFPGERLQGQAIAGLTACLGRIRSAAKRLGKDLGSILTAGSLPRAKGYLSLDFFF